MSDDVIYSSKTALFTLKGSIAVEYLDGQVLEGEFATQDAYNVFISVDSEPIMIPRQQIRFIKGVQGQQIEADTSQYSLQDIADRANTDDISTQPIPEPAIKPTEPEIPALSDIDIEDDDDGTFVLTTDIDELLQEVAIENDEYDVEEDDDDDDGTLIIVQDTGPEIDDDEDFGTVILETSDEMPAVSDEEDDELDLTVMLGDSLEEEDDETAEETAVTASLVCIAGPHIGDVLPLKQGIVSIGRSSDNALVLSNDKEISRHHAIVLHESGKYVVQDQNSLNGTFVNDEQITGPRYLEDGDIVLVGVSTLKYQEE